MNGARTFSITTIDFKEKYGRYRHLNEFYKVFSSAITLKTPSFYERNGIVNNAQDTFKHVNSKPSKVFFYQTVYFHQ